MKEFQQGMVRRFGVELLNHSLLPFERYWFEDEEMARQFKDEVIRDYGFAPAFVRFIKVI